jgi:hypothetical protein
MEFKEFPDSISAVSSVSSELTDSAGVSKFWYSSVTHILEELDELLETPKPPLITDSPPSPTKVAPMWQTIQTASTHFQHRFPGFRASTPLYQKFDTFYKLRIQFIWSEHEIPRSGELVYKLERTGLPENPYRASFDPFESTPQPHQHNGINWTGLYYVEFEPALYTLQKLLEKHFHQEAKDSEKSLFSLS